jgi:hypothetical protein
MADPTGPAPALLLASSVIASGAGACAPPPGPEPHPCATDDVMAAVDAELEALFPSVGPRGLSPGCGSSASGPSMLYAPAEVFQLEQRQQQQRRQQQQNDGNLLQHDSHTGATPAPSSWIPKQAGSPLLLPAAPSWVPTPRADTLLLAQHRHSQQQGLGGLALSSMLRDAQALLPMLRSAAAAQRTASAAATTPAAVLQQPGAQALALRSGAAAPMNSAGTMVPQTTTAPSGLPAWPQQQPQQQPQQHPKQQLHAASCLPFVHTAASGASTLTPAPLSSADTPQAGLSPRGARRASPDSSLSSGCDLRAVSATHSGAVAGGPQRPHQGATRGCEGSQVAAAGMVPAAAAPKPSVASPQPQLLPHSGSWEAASTAGSCAAAAGQPAVARQLAPTATEALHGTGEVAPTALGAPAGQVWRPAVGARYQQAVAPAAPSWQQRASAEGQQRARQVGAYQHQHLQLLDQQQAQMAALLERQRLEQEVLAASHHHIYSPSQGL